MATFILIHGAWMGAWIWRDITPLLLAKGHKVIAPDLPGSGNDQTSLEKINFLSYLDCLIKIINQQTEKVILVGHSMAGMIISAIGELMPDKIHLLIYLSAYLPQNGESMLDIVKKFQVNNYFEFDFLANDSACAVKKELIDKIFFNCCSKKYIVLAKLLMGLQVTKIFRTRLKLTSDNFGSVAKVYIKCTQDNAISSDAQNMMLDRQSVDHLYLIDTDHCPFFSSTNELAKILFLSSQNLAS